MDRFILHSEYKPTGDQPQAEEFVRHAFQNCGLEEFYME